MPSVEFNLQDPYFPFGSANPASHSSLSIASLPASFNDIPKTPDVVPDGFRLTDHHYHRSLYCLHHRHELSYHADTTVIAATEWLLGFSQWSRRPIYAPDETISRDLWDSLAVVFFRKWTNCSVDNIFRNKFLETTISIFIIILIY